MARENHIQHSDLIPTASNLQSTSRTLNFLCYFQTNYFDIRQRSGNHTEPKDGFILYSIFPSFHDAKQEERHDEYKVLMGSYCVAVASKT
jgi:hypothetical protein